ncbi:MAG: hypothetical protein HY899_11090, partial [Deltaproteobacteria bacterium]|nr:hypothetical protein [Deltaproteobacteria bacterium]
MSGSALDTLVERCACGEQPIVVVARTRRLARSLRLRVAERRAGDGVAVAEAPQIRTLDEWMAERADRIAPGRLLIGEAVENALWESVIAQPGGEDVAATLDLRALAEQAARAHERLCLWGEPDWDLQPLSRDAAAFRQWLALFRRSLLASAWVTAAELPALYVAALESGGPAVAAASSVALVGFERLEPVVERIVVALGKAGSSVELVEAGQAPAGTLVVRAAKTLGEEVRCVAREIHARLLADPRLRIGVLAPDVGAVRCLLERVFEEELETAGLFDLQPQRAR